MYLRHSVYPEGGKYGMSLDTASSSERRNGDLVQRERHGSDDVDNEGKIVMCQGLVLASSKQRADEGV